MKTILLSLLAISAFQLNGSAQPQTLQCTHPDPSPEALHHMHTLRSSQKSTDTKIIPVVFHILHQNGYENISDSQILDGLDNLNKDFQRLNADTSNIEAPFDTIIGKANFEFRLATIDPNGNPTTGIDRIFTPLTNIGDLTAMISEWDNLHYVNIWVVKNIVMGSAGFSTNPLLDPNPCVQGVLLLHEYIGSMGTASPGVSHILSHEMAHYFGLFHTWGNETGPGQSCAYSDGIYDTPRTQGNVSCNPLANTCDEALDTEGFAYWGFDPRDNIENFMDFSFCSFMFTNGQAEMLRSVAESPDYGRNILWTEANLIATGTGPGIQPISTAGPGSDFSIYSNLPSNSPYVYGMDCADNTIQFTAQNGNQAGTTYAWSFPGGVPASSALPNPSVLYVNPGNYDVTLTAANSNGSTTTAKTGVVIISGNAYDYNGPTLIEFDNAPSWITQNNDFDNGNFEQIPNTGVQNSGCFRLDNHYEIDSTALCVFNSPDQINGRKDNLISPAFNLSATTAVTVSYDLAYGSSAANDAAEVLKVYSSKDCGKTWTLRQTLQDNNLISANVLNTDFYVPGTTDWTHHTFNYNAVATDLKTRFRFEFVASNNSNNLYIDNFEINGMLGITEDEAAAITVFPNPAKQGSTVSISGLKAENASVTIFDMQGKKVFETAFQSDSSSETIELNHALKPGCYMVEVAQENSRFRIRLIVE